MSPIYKNTFVILLPVLAATLLATKEYGFDGALAASLVSLCWAVFAYLFFKSEVDDLNHVLAEKVSNYKNDLKVEQLFNEALKKEIEQREDDLNESKSKFSTLLDKTCEAGLLFDESAICAEIDGAELCMFGTLTLLYRRCFKHAETKSGYGTANQIARVAKNVLIRLNSVLQDSSSVVDKFDGGKIVRRIKPSSVTTDEEKLELQKSVKALARVMLSEHSLNVALAANKICMNRKINYTTRLIVCLAAALHDIGKAEGQGNISYDSSKHPIASRELADVVIREALNDLGVGYTPDWLQDVLDIVERHHTAEDRKGCPTIDKLAAIVRLADMVARETEHHRALNQPVATETKTITREEMFGDDDPLKPMKMPPAAELDPASKTDEALKELLIRFVAPTNKYFPVSRNGKSGYRYKAFESSGRIWVREDHCVETLKELFDENNWPPTIGPRTEYNWQSTLISILQAFDSSDEFCRVVCRDLMPDHYYGLPVHIMRKKHIESGADGEKPRVATYVPFHASKICTILGFDKEHFDKVRNDAARDTGETILHDIKRVDVCWNRDE